MGLMLKNSVKPINKAKSMTVEVVPTSPNFKNFLKSSEFEPEILHCFSLNPLPVGIYLYEGVLLNRCIRITKSTLVTIIIYSLRSCSQTCFIKGSYE